jgi:hypothetical protein
MQFTRLWKRHENQNRPPAAIRYVGRSFTIDAVATIDDAQRRVRQLHADLQRLVDRDPDQEVWDDIFPVLDAVVAVARDALPNDPVLWSIRDFVSADAISDDRQRRAAEILIVVGQILAAMPNANASASTTRRRLDRR